MYKYTVLQVIEPFHKQTHHLSYKKLKYIKNIPVSMS